MDAKEWYCIRIGVTEPYKTTQINTNFMCDLMQEYAEAYHASQVPSDYRYCPYCGEELRGEIETIVGSPLVCKNTMCKQSLTKRR